MKVFTSRFLWLGSILILSIPWIALGMPMAESSFINGSAVGLFGYLLNLKFKPVAPSTRVALILIAAGIAATILPALVSGLGALTEPPSRKSSLIGGFLSGWGLAELLHSFLFRNDNS